MEKIQINGKETPIAFNMKALFKFQKRTGVALDALDGVLQSDPEVMEILFFEALKEGHRIANVSFEILQEDVLAVDLASFQEYTRALNAAFETNPVKKKTGRNNQTGV